MPSRINLRYWAGAKRAAGREDESLEVETLADVRAALRARPAMRAIGEIATFLVDGIRVTDDTVLRDGAQVDVLPPFAGG